MAHKKCDLGAAHHLMRQQFDTHTHTAAVDSIDSKSLVRIIADIIIKKE